MAEIPPVSAARSVSAKIRSFSPAVNVRRFGRSDSSGLAAAGAGTIVGLRPSSVPAPAAACTSTTLLGMTTRQFSYALKSKHPGGLCLIIIGTEGDLSAGVVRGFIGTLQPSDSSDLPVRLRLLAFPNRPGTAKAVAGGRRSPRFRHDP